MAEAPLIRRPKEAPETGTPTTPGGGPEPTAPTRRTNEPGVGPAAQILEAVKQAPPQVGSTERATSELDEQGAASAGNVTPLDEAIVDLPQAHRQEVQEGGVTGRPRELRATGSGAGQSLIAGERKALADAETDLPPVAGDLSRESPDELRHDAGAGGAEEDPREREPRRAD